MISVIRTKENKLKNWCKKHGPFAERWLLIVGGVEGGDLFTSGEPLEEDERIESTFDRVYLYDVWARHVVLVSRERIQDAPEV